MYRAGRTGLWLEGRALLEEDTSALQTATRPLLWQRARCRLFSASVCVVKVEGTPYLCKTDEVGEICVNSSTAAAAYYGLLGITKSVFEVRAAPRPLCRGHVPQHRWASGRVGGRGQSRGPSEHPLCPARRRAGRGAQAAEPTGVGSPSGGLSRQALWPGEPLPSREAGTAHPSRRTPPPPACRPDGTPGPDLTIVLPPADGPGHCGGSARLRQAFHQDGAAGLHRAGEYVPLPGPGLQMGPQLRGGAAGRAQGSAPTVSSSPSARGAESGSCVCGPQASGPVQVSPTSGLSVLTPSLDVPSPLLQPRLRTPCPPLFSPVTVASGPRPACE